MSETFLVASTAAHYAAFADLIRAYVAWSRKRYEDDVGFVDAVFGHQSLEAELADLAQTYGPPAGRTVLARQSGEIVAGGAYRRLSEGICEMKRLFVPERVQGHGLGRRVCQALMRHAREDGFQVMRLDTGNRLVEAQALYRSLGFRDCPPYHDYPEALRPYLIFMEADLEEV
jgi:GNAT superfamily N-acetyltransferase